jgi:hypothetical protein
VLAVDATHHTAAIEPIAATGATTRQRSFIARRPGYFA